MNGAWNYFKARGFGLWLAVVVLMVDLWSKEWILDKAAVDALPVTLIPGWLDLVLAWNRGMSFSLMSNSAFAPYFLGLIAVVACAWFYHWLGVRERGSVWLFHTVGLGLLIGGALGNLYDRVEHHMVVDMLKVTLFGWNVPFIFNIADAAISGGVALLLWDAMGQEVVRIYYVIYNKFGFKKEQKNA